MQTGAKRKLKYNSVIWKWFKRDNCIYHIDLGLIVVKRTKQKTAEMELLLTRVGSPSETMNNWRIVRIRKKVQHTKKSD